MFRPCWVIFREKLYVVVTLCCTIHLSENVLLTVHCATYGGVNCLWSRHVQASKSGAVPSQQHILAQLYSAT
jgi:hypothetical protein